MLRDSNNNNYIKNENAYLVLYVIEKIDKVI